MRREHGSTTSSITEAREIERTIKDRWIDYWDDVDRNNARDALTFYTRDCIYQMADIRMEGPEAVAAYYAYRNQRGSRVVRHIVSNLRVTLHSGETASLRGLLCAYAADGPPVLPVILPVIVADTDCEFIRTSTSDVWKMRSHKLTALFADNTRLLRPPTPAA